MKSSPRPVVRIAFGVLGLTVWVAVAGGGTYEEAFDAYAIGATNFTGGAELRSTAIGTVAALADAGQKELQLTGAATYDVRSAFTLPDLDPGQAVSAFSLYWNSQVYADTNRGEGLSATFGAIPMTPESTNYNQEAGFATGLTFSVETSIAATTNAGFRLYENGRQLAFLSYTNWGTKLGTRHAFAFYLRPPGRLEAWMDGARIFAGVATAWSPQTGDRFCFAARTGTNRAAEARLDNIVAVTGEGLTEGEWTAFASSGTSPAAEGPEKAFDRAPGTKWLMLNAQSGQLAARTADTRPHRMRAYTITSGNDAPARDPATWALQGSRNGADWTTLDSVAGATWGTQRYCTRAFLIDAPAAFSWYRLDISSNHGDASTQLADVRLYEAPTNLAVTTSVIRSTIRDFDREDLTQTPSIATKDGGEYTPGVVDGPALGHVYQLTDGGSGEFARLAFARTFDVTNSAWGRAPDILIDFDLRAQPSNGQADGIALALLRTADYGLSGPGVALNEEPNLTSSNGPNFAIGFDIYDNGTPQDGGNNNHVSLHYGTFLASKNPGFDFSNTRFHHAHVRIAFRADRSGADVSVSMQENSLGMESIASGTPVDVFTNYFVAGFTPYDCRLQFSARTGGATAIQQLDNIYALCGAGGTAYGGDFRGTDAKLALLGNARLRTDTGGGVYQHWLSLTDNGGDERGSAWLREPQPVVNGFSCDFDWRVSHFGGAGAGADGLCFSIHNNGLTQLVGENGPLTNAFTLGFDTYQNAGEPSATWIKVADGPIIVASLNLIGAGFDFNYNPAGLPYAGRYNVHIDYAPGDLDVFLNDALVIDSLNIDLADLSSGSAVDARGRGIVGFSARTGGQTENHDILTFRMATSLPLEPAGTVLFLR